jgi:CBS domain containing-hemolysin-like protein
MSYPLVLALNGIGNGLLRLAGIDRAAGSSEAYRTPEEIAYIVRESRAGGLLRQQAANVLEELLELGELTAGEVMVPRVHVVGIPADASDEDVASLFRSEPHARYPVYEGDLDHVIGMVHVKDLLRSRVRGEGFNAVPRRPVAFLPLSASADDILAAMRRTRSQLVVVMDEHGGTAGIVTLEDLFEEVVGEVTDDQSEPEEVYRDEHGRLHVLGTARVEEVAEALGVVLDFEDADTVSGLVLALLKRPPQVGDRVEWEEAAFEVTAVYGHGVEECVVALKDGAGPSS